MTEVRPPWKLRSSRRTATGQPANTPPTHVEGGYGRVPASPVDVDPPAPQMPKLRDSEARALMAAELVQACRQVTESSTALTAQIGRAGSVNGVLLVDLVALDSDGRWSRSFGVQVGSVVVTNLGETGPMYVQSGDGATPPFAGVGVQLVPAGATVRMPVAAHALTIWGQAGTLANVQAYTGLQALGVGL